MCELSAEAFEADWVPQLTLRNTYGIPFVFRRKQTVLSVPIMAIGASIRKKACSFSGVDLYAIDSYSSEEPNKR